MEKGDRFAEVRQRGQETQQRAKSIHGKANSVWLGEQRDVSLLGHRKEKQQELQHTACFSELSEHQWAQNQPCGSAQGMSEKGQMEGHGLWAWGGAAKCRNRAL